MICYGAVFEAVSVILLGFGFAETKPKLPGLCGHFFLHPHSFYVHSYMVIKRSNCPPYNRYLGKLLDFAFQK